MSDLPYIRIEEAKRKVCPYRVFTSVDGEDMAWSCEADGCMRWEPSPWPKHGTKSLNGNTILSKTHGRCGA